MKAVYVRARSDGSLVYGEANTPRVGANGVLIQVQASAMNPHDWKYYEWCRKFYTGILPLPRLPIGHDVAGTVLRVGHKVSKFKPGDSVYGMSAMPGAFAEQIAIDQRMLSHSPANCSPTEAASIPMAALTALQGLRMCQTGAGSNVLIVGGSGGVGVFAVQLAKALGATVTAVCSGRNAEFVRSIGADTVIDYTQQDYLNSEDSFDIIFDTIGGQNAKACSGILRRNAYFLSTGTSLANILEIVRSRLVALFVPGAVKAGTLLAMPRGSDLRFIADLVEADKVKPEVEISFPLDKLDAAIAHSKRGRTRGKIAITVVPE